MPCLILAWIAEPTPSFPYAPTRLTVRFSSFWCQQLAWWTAGRLLLTALLKTSLAFSPNDFFSSASSGLVSLLFFLGEDDFRAGDLRMAEADTERAPFARLIRSEAAGYLCQRTD